MMLNETTMTDLMFARLECLMTARNLERSFVPRSEAADVFRQVADVIEGVINAEAVRRHENH
jgi:hypothetical protein